MMRRKGWCQQYLDMDRKEVAAEVRRLEQGRGYIYDREAKLAFLRNPHLGPNYLDLGSQSPGNVTWMPAGTTFR